MSKYLSSSLTTGLTMVFLFLVICQLALAAPAAFSATDSENIRELFEAWLRQEAPNQFFHQMERKAAARTPTLRLRFGRRSDPLWSKMSSLSVSDDGFMEKVPYK